MESSSQPGQHPHWTIECERIVFSNNSNDFEFLQRTIEYTRQAFHFEDKTKKRLPWNRVPTLENSDPAQVHVKV